MRVRIGRVRQNGKLALHLSINGVTCASNRRITLETTTKNASNAKLCRSCFTPARVAKAQTQAQSGRFDQHTDTVLAWASDMVATPAEKARVAELVARYHADRPAAPVREISVFGRMKAAHAAARQLAKVA